MEEKEKWLIRLKEKLDDHMEPLPFNGWDRLEQELRPVSRSRQLYTWGAVAAVTLLLLLPAGWWFLQAPIPDDLHEIQPPQLVVVTEQKPEPTEPVTDIIQPTSQAKERNIISSLPSGSRKTDTSVREEKVLQEQGANLPSVQVTGENQQVITDIEQQVVETTKNQTEEKRSGKEVHRPSDRSKYHLPVSTKSVLADNKKWSFGVRAGNAGLVSEGMDQLPLTPANGDRISLSTMSNGASVAINQEVVVKGHLPLLVETETGVTDAKHRQPVTVGFTVRKDIGNGFSLESGLTYTFLSSDITVAHDKVYTQKLHYMGVPVRGNWDFFEKNNFTLYLSAGGTVEKCISGKFGDEKKTEGPLQLSVMGAVGAQYSPTKRVAFYFEPGVSYYFDNGSDFVTIRKDNPFNLNLQAGIRLLY